MTKLKALAQSAVNFDANRGDTINVVNLQFAQAETPKEGASSGEGLIAGPPKADVFHMVETLILAVIGLLVVLLVVRPVSAQDPRDPPVRLPVASKACWPAPMPEPARAVPPNCRLPPHPAAVLAAISRPKWRRKNRR